VELIHKSSIFIAPGFSQISELVKQKKIKAYIITARYSFLGPELLKWAEKNGFGSVFTEIHYNAKDEQPHLFKARLINKLKLDYFVEDNLDIVRYVEGKTQTTILWIYNIFDKGVYYPRRYPYLKKAVEYSRGPSENAHRISDFPITSILCLGNHDFPFLALSHSPQTRSQGSRPPRKTSVWIT
jgi:hypothetical protein